MRTWTQPADHRLGSYEELAATVCEAIKPLLDPHVDGWDRGLYLVTGDAGIQRAVRFWADALAETPRFASPAGFPWTLANAPAGYIARELGIHGPNHTLVGEAPALSAAVGHGVSDLVHGIVSEAVLVVMDLAAPVQSAVLVVASREADPVALESRLTAATAAVSPPDRSETTHKVS